VIRRIAEIRGSRDQTPLLSFRDVHPPPPPGALRPDHVLDAEADPVQLFVTAIQNPVQFAVAGIIAGGFVVIFLRAAMSPERRSGSIGWVRAVTGPSARYLFGFLAVVWVVGFGFLIPQFPNTAESPYGALALMAMFAGFFIMMGLLWSVIGE
jgi:hypothetical protein